MTTGPAQLGLDFGMTNSLLTVWDASRGPMPFRATGSNAFIVPTVVDAPEKTITLRLWGLAARLLPGFLHNFKMGLPRAGGLTGEARETNLEFRAARAFLESLFADFHKRSGYREIGNLVVTVPETWLRGGEQAGCDAMREILSALDLPTPRFVSEPVAAGCYFAYRYREATGKDFDGHALVYDHGGGTLDLALLRVCGKRVRLIEGRGRSAESGQLGFGGVQFDHRVLERIEKRGGLSRLQGQARKTWLDDFEAKKRQSAVPIENYCKSAKYQLFQPSKVFTVQGTAVLLSDLTDTFDQDFAPKIESVLTQVLHQARGQDQIDIGNPQRFRVVAVGGFSEFGPVQRLLGRILMRESGTLEVTRNHLNRDDRWLAIAKGACLVSAGNVNLEERCPFTFGVVCWRKDQQDHIDLMRKGESLDLYEDPRFHLTRFQLAQLDDHGALRFYIVQGDRRVPLRMRRSFNEVLPDFGQATRWMLGAQVAGGVVSILISSDLGSPPRVVQMGEFLNLVQGKLEEVFRD